MSAITKFTLKDVRCFSGVKEFNIRPLTFLVGENSTGKSTMLGCFQALCDFMSDKGDIDFNKNPYQMGAFVDIVRKSRPHIATFELGFVAEEVEYRLTLRERGDGSEPVIKEVWMGFDNGEITVKLTENNKGSHRYDVLNDIRIEESGKNRFTLFFGQDTFYIFSMLTNIRHMYFLMGRRNDILSSKQKSIPAAYKKVMKLLKGHADRENRRSLSLWDSDEFKTYSFAPIRSKPARTYDPVKEIASPEGSEMPVVLMNLSRSNKIEWERLKDRLEDFGRESGLFTDIGVRSLGRSSASDPFQLQIKVRGPKGNIMDVGYGVSQILPILVRVLSARRSGRFLLQQPEVHLHPRGQSALTVLLIDGVKRKPRSQKFIVETHSDYMINRARIEILKKNIKPEDVSLIYLQPVDNKVEVHNIEFDAQANMINVPQGYRDFFLKEGNELLGFGI